MSQDIKDFLILKKTEHGKYLVYWENDVYIGDFLVKEDGFYDFWEEHRPGTYKPAHMLRALADKLDELNKDWEETIANDPVFNRIGHKIL